MKKDLRILVQTVLILFFLAGLLMVSRRNRLFVENSGCKVMMGTFAQVTVAVRTEAQARDLFTLAFDEMERLQVMMNDRDPNAELSRLGETAFEEPVRVSPELFEVLSAAVEYSRLSEGAFDITVGPEVRLWRNMQENGKRPTPEQLAQARARVGWDKLILDPGNQTVRLAVEGMQLDVGAIAKGYAVDRAVRLLIDAKVPAGMVDLGGNIRCFGLLPQYPQGWLIGLQSPREENKLLARLALRDMSIATSGDYRRYAQVDGQKQSHILDPKTGRSVEDLISVTILAPTAMQADILSTAVSVLGKEKGMRLVESLDNTHAFLVTAADPNQLITTPGADIFILTDKRNKGK